MLIEEAKVAFELVTVDSSLRVGRYCKIRHANTFTCTPFFFGLRCSAHGFQGLLFDVYC